MAEIGGITELQLLQADIVLLKKQLEGVQSGENTSLACARIAGNIEAGEAKDGFLIKEGQDPNQFHTSAGPAAEEGCCTVL
mmetsp:Transcript_24817/g.35375  ORF Transcript_24817/g.35375 Transcript_24817/m.35375 type:complete len:81 (-) Transcript_24817:264-506(-)|eukprot:CAMPEP_0202449008 /NCGR_PEP_ID=MMETSP1360-20130828/7801_1 /ASSEMBLY_ACC=CAM_ASM_000848 /TAXON_ID=515479 /ORGANISM="Licmophora paradoxa, Strain CCMP2313" /LENGTH=80 /DNA_ID=CAMNT_0049066815 /DNA_START=92 /DNA_END=334 /DNA_ORIENTATION=-